MTVTTSHNSNWQGTFDQSRKVLTVNYFRKQHSGRVILWLNDQGDVLEGEWFNHKGGSGRYIAVRLGVQISNLNTLGFI